MKAFKTQITIKLSFKRFILYFFSITKAKLGLVINNYFFNINP